MKKVTAFLLTIFSGLGLVACGSKIDYTKEFQYLPAVKNMINVSFVKDDNDENAKAEYKIKSVEVDEIISEYKELLKTQDWKIAELDNTTFFATKDEYNVTIQITADESDAKIIIIAKAHVSKE